MLTSIVTLTCLLNLILSCESARQQLNSIDDLKKIDFGRSVPKHSLLLLYWFASVVNIDHHNTITATFNPNAEFGSHHYGNYEEMLDPPQQGYLYYTVGNLKPGPSTKLPGYIRNPPDRDYNGSNRDRIVFSAEWQISGAYQIDRVFLTQHRPSSNTYDPQHTYYISTNLLRQIREFSNGNPTALWRLRNQFYGDIDDSQITALSLTWGDGLACLGLLLFIVTQRNYSRPFDTHNNTKTTSTTITFPLDEESSSSNRETDDTCADICLKVIGILLLILIIIVVILYWNRGG